MSRMVMLGSLLGISVAMSVGGCNIETCETGAHCMDGQKGDDDDDDGESEHDQCLALCERMSVCGAPQARDLDDCIDACEDRFEVLPAQTAELCECIPRSRCEDVIDGRCTDPGSGGSGGTGGSHATGGSGHGGTTGGSDAGGSPTTGGSSGTGGSAETGGSDSGGSSGSSTGGSSTGGSTTGGTSSGGGGGEDPGTPCTCSCQCPSGETCVEGYCSG